MRDSALDRELIAGSQVMHVVPHGKSHLTLSDERSHRE
jgi:hypothetical protein